MHHGSVWTQRTGPPVSEPHGSTSPAGHLASTKATAPRAFPLPPTRGPRGRSPLTRPDVGAARNPLPSLSHRSGETAQHAEEKIYKKNPSRSVLPGDEARSGIAGRFSKSLPTPHSFRFVRVPPPPILTRLLLLSRRAAASQSRGVEEDPRPGTRPPPSLFVRSWLGLLVGFRDFDLLLLIASRDRSFFFCWTASFFFCWIDR